MINSNSIDSNNEDLDLNILLNILLRKKKFIVFITLLSSLISSIFVLKTKPIYKGSFNIVIKEDQQTNLSTNNSLLNSLISKQDDNETQKLILSSPSVLLPVYEYVKRYNDEKGIDISDISFSKWAKTSLNIDFKKRSTVLQVAYKSSDKKLILETLQMISAKYKDYSKKETERSINKTLKYLESQTDLMSKKALKSQREFNLFSIENGLGNIDGFVGLGKNSSPLSYRSDLSSLFKMQNNSSFGNSSLIQNLKNSNSNLNFGNLTSGGEASKTNAGQRYTNQFALLERYESKYVDLSSKLKPNSKTLMILKDKIDNLRSSLKRPNQILSEYKVLQNKAIRDERILTELEDNLQVMKLEKIKTPTPWEMISIPTIEDEIVFPQKKKIVFLSFLISFLISSFISIYYEKLLGDIYEPHEFRKKIPYKFLGTLYQNEKNLNSLIIKKFINIKNENSKIGLINLSNKFFENQQSNELILDEEIINFKMIEINQNYKSSDVEDVILIATPGNINKKNIQILNNYIIPIKNKIRGWIFLDFKK